MYPPPTHTHVCTHTYTHTHAHTHIHCSANLYTGPGSVDAMPMARPVSAPVRGRAHRAATPSTQGAPPSAAGTRAEAGADLALIFEKLVQEQCRCKGVMRSTGLPHPQHKLPHPQYKLPQGTGIRCRSVAHAFFRGEFWSSKYRNVARANRAATPLTQGAPPSAAGTRAVAGVDLAVIF